MAWTTWISIGSFSGALAVILGAFGAHAMKGRYGDDLLAIFETGVKYQMYHALALLAVATVASRIDGALVRTAGYMFLIGTVIFSGSLYALVFTGNRSLGMVTPIGGVALVLGWVCLGLATLGPFVR
jgi:uncharacterized membrane protein YgdD (TMEM256/DUF423 family)